MFSGITQGLFPVVSLIREKELFHYAVALNATLVNDLKLGASMAIDGVCQTVVAINQLEVSFDAGSETLSKTTLNDLFVNRKVSVERSLSLGAEVGGHEVSGHVLEKGYIIARKKSNKNLFLTIQCSKKCFAFIKTKGYIAVDGSSLTVNALHKIQNSFDVCLIPETLCLTNFANKAVGDAVNLEPDMKIIIWVETIQESFADLQNRLAKLEKRLAALESYHYP